jgi:hypothetical protein
VGVLGMLGSSHAGERDAAAQLATRMVRGLTREALVVVPRLEAQSEPSQSEPTPDPPPPGWRELARRCGTHPRWLSDWERMFLAGLPRWARLSSKQLVTLDRIVLKLRSRGVAV